MGARRKAVVAWSSGKDSAFALHVERLAGELELVGILTTVTEGYGRVAMHGVREELLDRQAEQLGLTCLKVRLPPVCTNEIYEERMAAAIRDLQAAGVSRVVFGDLFLEDIRAYRERQMSGLEIECRFPLWGRDTAELAREMLDSGLRSTLVSVDPRVLDRTFAGRDFDAALLGELPPEVDPCGENGEFHTVATAGPMFRQAIPIEKGVVVERDGFVFADVVPA